MDSYLPELLKFYWVIKSQSHGGGRSVPGMACPPLLGASDSENWTLSPTGRLHLAPWSEPCSVPGPHRLLQGSGDSDTWPINAKWKRRWMLAIQPSTTNQSDGTYLSHPTLLWETGLMRCSPSVHPETACLIHQATKTSASYFSLQDSFLTELPGSLETSLYPSSSVGWPMVTLCAHFSGITFTKGHWDLFTRY